MLCGFAGACIAADVCRSVTVVLAMPCLCRRSFATFERVGRAGAHKTYVYAHFKLSARIFPGVVAVNMLQSMHLRLQSRLHGRSGLSCQRPRARLASLFLDVYRLYCICCVGVDALAVSLSLLSLLCAAWLACALRVGGRRIARIPLRIPCIIDANVFINAVGWLEVCAAAPRVRPCLRLLFSAGHFQLDS